MILSAEVDMAQGSDLIERRERVGRIRICVGVFLGAVLSAKAIAGPETLTYMCEDIPPSNYLENGELKGASIEVLHLLWKSMGLPAQEVKVVPWARGYNSLQVDSNRVLFSMTRTPQREKLFKWVGPIFSVKSVLMGLTSRSGAIREATENKTVRIGLIKDDVAEKFLAEQGIDQGHVEAVSNLEQNFGKLKAGRIDLVAHTENTLQAHILKHRLSSSEYKVYQILSDSPNYYAFSRDVPDDWIARFQKALDGTRKSREKILSKYGLSL